MTESKRNHYRTASLMTTFAFESLLFHFRTLPSLPREVNLPRNRNSNTAICLTAEFMKLVQLDRLG